MGKEIQLKPASEHKKILVLGGGGFIGSHLVNKFVEQGHYVGMADLKLPDFSESRAHSIKLVDLRDRGVMQDLFFPKGYWDEVYQLAANMGGAGYIFSGANDANVILDNSLINHNVATACVAFGVKKVFFASSACIYPAHNQTDPNNPMCSEASAYPANPDSEYGWEKLFSERIYLALARNYGLNVRIGRFHNIFGPEGTYDGGKEKAPAALCRKVAKAKRNGSIEVWGDGLQTRSFLYIDECLEAVERLMQSNYTQPVNIGSEEMVTLNQLAQMVIAISGKKLKIKNVETTVQGVRGRNSDNKLIAEQLNWQPTQPLNTGLQKTYEWVKAQVEKL